MRLIDADALIDRIKNPYEQAQVARWVNEQPTIEPEKRMEERMETHACDLIDRQALMKEFSDFVRASNNSDFARTPTWNDAVSLVGSMPSAQPEIKPIDYQDCANAMLRMWMDGVVTDGEYNRIMDKLNALEIMPDQQGKNRMQH